MLAAGAVERRIAGERPSALRTRGEVPRATMWTARALDAHPVGLHGGKRRPVPGRAVAIFQGALVCRHALTPNLAAGPSARRPTRPLANSTDRIGRRATRGQW